MTASEQSGYELSSSDFVRLVKEPAWREKILPLIEEWFGLRPMQDGAVEFAEESGRRRTIYEIHAAIQRDPDKQRRLYQTAMDLWR